MTTERDTDRRLRAWVSEGIDQSPERFVWAALDEIDRLPQRAAWRTTVETLVGARARPWMGPALGFAAAVVIAVGIALVTLRPVPSVGPARPFGAGDLEAVVIWQDTKPAGWRLDNLVSNPTEVRRIPIRSLPDAQVVELADPAGLLAGRYTNFTGQPDGAFMSWALLFEDDADAARALPFYQEELRGPNAWGLGQPVVIDLGDQGYLYAGETTAFSGRPTGVNPIRAAVYLWRDGNLLLAVGGWFAFDEAELRRAAEGMDARAGSVRSR